MIKWNSVYESLPENDKNVILLVEGNSMVFTGFFTPDYGWSLETRNRMMDPIMIKILFWSYYEIPDSHLIKDSSQL